MTFTHITAVVNESGYVSTFGGINDGLLINSEHVTASNATFLITLLSHISNYLKRKKKRFFLFKSPLRRTQNEQRFLASHCVQCEKKERRRRTWEEELEKKNLCTSHLSDDFTHILNHHLICCYRLHSEQAPLMNATRTETSHFLAKLLFRERKGFWNLFKTLFSLFKTKKKKNQDWQKKKNVVKRDHTKHVVSVCYSLMKNIFIIFKHNFSVFYWTYSTFSWLNLSKSLSELKEDSRRRCSNLKSDPQRSDSGCWAELIVSWDKNCPQSALTGSEVFADAPLEYLSRWELSGRRCVVDILLLLFDTDSVETFTPSGAASVLR